MGSFRLAAGRGYLHPQYNFAESLAETVGMSLRHSSVRPYTSSSEFAESCVFSKQSQPPFHCDPWLLRACALDSYGHTFSRSYGAILPSSLASVLSRALGYSPRPPESVCGTDTKEAPRAAFLGSLESLSSRSEDQPHHVSALTPRLSLSRPTRSAYALEPTTKQWDQHILLRPCSLQRHP